MILDSLKNFKTYMGLHERFSKVAEFFDKTNLAELADGRYEIDGKEVFVTIGNYALKTPEIAALEAHDKFIDIQVVVDGYEGFGWKWRENCADPRGEMNLEKDIIFYNDRPSATVKADAGEFVIFFPDDAHAPLTGNGNEAATVRKCVFKVRY